MDIKTRLKPEGSIVSGVAVSGSVLALYSMSCGQMAEAYASDSNHPALESSRKKCAITAFLFVSVMTLLTKDANVGILGYGTLVAVDMSYRHSIMADPATGIVQPPAEATYAPAENVTPIYQQAV